MLHKKISPLFLFLYIAILSIGYTADSPWLYGIHWYGNTGSTDVESMSGGKGIWDLEITNLDTAQAPAWDLPSYYAGSVCPTVTSRGHSLVFRTHAYWSRNVPNSGDPYTKLNYASDCQLMANTLKNYVHIWQIGNEVNLYGENLKWNGSSYVTQWAPDPTEYSTTYMYCRDSIHNITPLSSPSTQIVLMQPNSPGNADGSVRFMDGNEYLWRQIQATNSNKIDGFALHSYAEPGGSNYGVDGFMDTIREQLMIIDQLGQGNKPVFITEWNKHMPDTSNTNIGAKFLSRALKTLNTWNTSSGGEWPGLTNHNIVGTNWFVYPAGLGWDDYALYAKKTAIGSTDPELNPWYSFNSVANLNYAKGASGNGPTVPQTTLWFQDLFLGSSLDTTGPLPSWKAEVSGSGGSGSVTMSGDSGVRFLGNGALDGGGGVRTAGYVFGNFRLETDLTFTNAARSSVTDTEANFDVRLREGSLGYSLTIYPSTSGVRGGQIWLRRTNNWGENIGSLNQAISGGINTGDSFHLSIIANDSSLTYKVYKNGSSSPSVNWALTDSGQKVGWLRFMTWNLNEARLYNVQLGGPQWLPNVHVENWKSFLN